MSVQLRAGATATGNPFPVAVNLDDIIPEGSGTSDSVVIQTLDAAGGTIDSYAWNDWMYGKGCWVDSYFAEATGVTFTPGQGLWVYGASDAQYLHFPAPELNN